MNRFLYIPEFPILSSPPSNPTSGFNKFYYDSSIEEFVSYSPIRSKWLSEHTFPIHIARNGNLAVGTSFRTTDGLATSTAPILLERNCTLVGIVASTSDLEQFVLGVDDVSTGGSGNTIAINYEATGPTTTRNLIKLDLNQDYNAGDELDIYVVSSVTGNIADPRIKLLFKYRV